MNEPADPGRPDQPDEPDAPERPLSDEEIDTEAIGCMTIGCYMLVIGTLLIVGVYNQWDAALQGALLLTFFGHAGYEAEKWLARRKGRWPRGQVVVAILYTLIFASLCYAVVRLLSG